MLSLQRVSFDLSSHPESCDLWPCHVSVPYWIVDTNLLLHMMMSSNGNIFCVTGPLCAGNSPVTGEFPAQRPVTQSFDVFFDLCLNKWLSKQLWCWWFKMPSHSLWCNCNVYVDVLVPKSARTSADTAMITLLNIFKLSLASDWVLDISRIFHLPNCPNSTAFKAVCIEFIIQRKLCSQNNLLPIKQNHQNGWQ